MADPDIIEIKLDSNAAAVARQVSDFSAKIAPAIAAALDLQNELTVAEIGERKLSMRGPNTLGVVTNRLRLSVRPSTAHVSEERIVSAIGSNVKYAGAHEFGFQGPVSVAGHSRRRFGKGRGGNRAILTKTKFVRMDDGRIVEERTKRSVKLIGTTQVRPHTRKMNIPQRSYLRTGINERRATYGEAVAKAIIDAWGAA